MIHAARQCPIQLKDEIKDYLDEMVDNGVIGKLVQPTDSVRTAWFTRETKMESYTSAWTAKILTTPLQIT